MKINFLLPHLKNSGGVRIILTYAELLKAKGHEVNILTRSSGKKIIKNIFIKEYCWFGKLRSKVLLKRNFCSADIPEADVTIADSWNMAKILIKAEDKVGKKINFVQHDERLFHGDKELVEEVYNNDMSKIVVSSWLEKIFENELNKKTFKLINPVEEIFLKSTAREKHVDIKVLLLNHTYLWKGVDEGLETLEKLKLKFKDLHISVLAFGSRLKTKDDRIDEYFYDLNRNDIAKLYRSADIYLCPSWYEGYGLPSVEAMASGCALVTYDNGGSWDYAIPDKTAFVAKNQDKDDLFLKLEEAVINSEKRLKIAETGRSFVNDLPHWQEQTDRLEKYLINLISA
jgi:glycosyltransferase involved in cell wall biosynthesis